MVVALGLTVVGWSGKPEDVVLLGGYTEKLKTFNEELERKTRRGIIIGWRAREYTTKINKSVSSIGADMRVVLGDGAEEETRTREAIHSEVEPQLDRLLDYHTAELDKNAELPSGILTTCFRIIPSGETSEIEILDDGQGRSGLKRAIAKDIKRWRFEPARGDVFVVYNFVFYRSCDGEEERKWGRPFQRDCAYYAYADEIRRKGIEVIDDEDFYGEIR
ncbi:MAG: hypothetical protein GY771_17515 [bacterium]|nr:hypothetical protein [bacterium]